MNKVFFERLRLVDRQKYDFELTHLTFALILFRHQRQFLSYRHKYQLRNNSKISYKFRKVSNIFKRFSFYREKFVFFLKQIDN